MSALWLYILVFFIFLSFLIGQKLYRLSKMPNLSRKVLFHFLDPLLIILSVLCILITLLWDFNYLQYKPPMEYEDWEQITFNDFRGLKRPGYSSDRENHKANTYTTISTRNMGDHIEIKSLFHPCRSYVYDRDLYHNQLLVHELYHFHITEYFARLMRRDIHHLSRSNRTIDLKNLERSYYYEESELQRAYDHETDHGILKGKQLEWQRKIDSSLLSLSDYSDVAIDLN